MSSRFRQALIPYLFLFSVTLSGGSLTLSIPQLNPNYTAISAVGTPIATGLNFPYGIATTANGSLLFGQTLTTTAAGVYYGSGPAVGSVWLQPKQADGSFGAPQKVIDGLSGIVTSVRSLPDGTVVVDSGSGGSGGAGTRVMSFYNSSWQSIGAMQFQYPAIGWEHSTGASLAVPNPDGSVSLYFNMGSRDDADPTTAIVTTTGLVAATLHGDSLYRLTIKPGPTSVQVLDTPVQVADGLRNPYGLAVDAAGGLYIGDNGIDGMHNPDELGADTLKQLGSQFTDFGFPHSYVSFATGQMVNGDPNAVAPLVAFTPVADAGGSLQKSEGVAGLAYAPAGSLPFVGASGGFVIGFHGVFDSAGASNYDNALLYYDLAAAKTFVLIDAGTAGVGHLDSVWVNGHSLYLADMQPTGLVNSPSGLGQGVVYQVDFSSAYATSAAPEPTTAWLAGGAMLAGLVHRRRRRFGTR